MRRAVVLICLVIPGLASGGTSPRFTPSYQLSYSGRHQDLFVQNQERVRLLLRQAQLEASSRLGLVQYRDGFSCPLTVRFEDVPVPGAEHTLAFVQLYLSPTQGVRQEMVINLDVISQYNDQDFDRIFYHEMTHAVMNDAVEGIATSKIPHWVQEGLAMYVSEEGEDRVRRAAPQFKKSQVHALVMPLDGPYTGAAYVQYYLAVKYLYDRHTVSSIQMLVRSLIKGMPIREAVEDATGLTWEKFQTEVNAYSLRILQEHARPDY